MSILICMPFTLVLTPNLWDKEQNNNEEEDDEEKVDELLDLESINFGVGLCQFIVNKLFPIGLCVPNLSAFFSDFFNPD